MKITFEQSIEQSATEFYLLRQRAIDVDAFDRATEAMRAERYVVDITKGIVRNRNGFVSSFTNYDWAHEYGAAPHFVFYDFFRGLLLNKYDRNLRGLNP